MKNSNIVFNRKFSFKYNHWIFRLPILKNFGGIVLFGTVYFKDDYDKIPKSMILHEMTHIEQMKDDGYFLFYFKYIYYHIRGYMKWKNHWDAYWFNPYEIEARYNEEERNL